MKRTILSLGIAFVLMLASSPLPVSDATGATAAAAEQEKRKRTRRVPTMSELTYKRLAKAQEGIDAKDLDAALARADAEISAKAGESEARIGEIKAGALDAVKEVATEAAKDIVAALGGKGDAKSVSAAVNARLLAGLVNKRSVSCKFITSK